MEQRYGLSKFSNFLHTFVMSTFIQRVCDDMKNKTQTTLSRSDVWSALSSTAAHNVVSFWLNLSEFKALSKLHTFHTCNEEKSTNFSKTSSQFFLCQYPSPSRKWSEWRYTLWINKIRSLAHSMWFI